MFWVIIYIYKPSVMVETQSQKKKKKPSVIPKSLLSP